MTTIRPYHIQEHRQQWLPFFNVFRVNYDALLNSLRYPVIWARDEYLGAWLPAEVDWDFIHYAKTLSAEFDEGVLEKGRLRQLHRAGMVAPERNSVDHLRAQVRAYGHCKIQNLLHPEYCKSTLKNYYWRNDHLHDRWKDLEGIKRTSANNLPLMRLVHQATESLVRSVLCEDVKTSYSFTSAYETGTCLPAHTDRPQCVYNVSFLLGSDPPDARLSRWPLFIRYEESTYRVELEAGDGVLYSGVRDLHWRDEMPREIASTLGVFFHYVPVSFEGSLD